MGHSLNPAAQVQVTAIFATLLRAARPKSEKAQLIADAAENGYPTRVWCSIARAGHAVDGLSQKGERVRLAHR